MIINNIFEEIINTPVCSLLYLSHAHWAALFLQSKIYPKCVFSLQSVERFLVPVVETFLASARANLLPRCCWTALSSCSFAVELIDLPNTNVKYSNLDIPT